MQLYAARHVSLAVSHMSPGLKFQRPNRRCRGHLGPLWAVEMRFSSYSATSTVLSLEIIFRIANAIWLYGDIGFNYINAVGYGFLTRFRHRRYCKYPWPGPEIGQTVQRPKYEHVRYRFSHIPAGSDYRFLTAGRAPAKPHCQCEVKTTVTQSRIPTRCGAIWRRSTPCSIGSFGY